MRFWRKGNQSLKGSKLGSSISIKEIFDLKLGLLIVLSFISICQSMGQFQSIDFEISTSPYFDDRTDDEYNFAHRSLFGISQFGIGYSASLNDKLVISPKVAFGIGSERYSTRRLSPFPNSNPDSIFIEKIKNARFLKIGLGGSYWFNSPGEGVFIESELQSIFSLSAISEESKQIGFGASVQEQTIDYKDELKSMVPSLRLGVGYSLTISKIILFVRVGLEFRGSTYFTTTDNYSWANKSLGFGFRYILQNKKTIQSD